MDKKETGGFFKNMAVRTDQWKGNDPDRNFRNKIIKSIGTYKYIQLVTLMDMYKIFDQDFFKSRFFLEIPEEYKMINFVIFINNWAHVLLENNNIKEAEEILRISIELKEDSNAAHFDLACILMKKGNYREAIAEARNALKAGKEIKDLAESIPLPSEFKITDAGMVEMESATNAIIAQAEQMLKNG